MNSYKVCSDSGEDKSCSNKFFPEYDPNDHDHYFIFISQTQCWLWSSPILSWKEPSYCPSNNQENTSSYIHQWNLILCSKHALIASIIHRSIYNIRILRYKDRIFIILPESYLAPRTLLTHIEPLRLPRITSFTRL